MELANFQQSIFTPEFILLGLLEQEDSGIMRILEEIEMEAGTDFKQNGGEEFKMISCLNDDNQWMDTMASWINDWAHKK